MPITNFIWDEVDDSVLMETDEAGNTTAMYTHEPGPFGGLISERRGNESRYYHSDAVGSTRHLTNAAGQVTDSFLYDAFGNTIQHTGSTFVPYHFVGRSGYYDDEELLRYYVRARHYDPRVARWLSADPLLWFRPANPAYVYGNGNPLRLSDPSGLDACDEPCTEKNVGEYRVDVLSVAIGAAHLSPGDLEFLHSLVETVDWADTIGDVIQVSGAAITSVEQLMESLVEVGLDNPCESATGHVGLLIASNLAELIKGSSGAQIYVKLQSRGCVCCRRFQGLSVSYSWHTWHTQWFEDCRTNAHIFGGRAIELPVSLKVVRECIQQAKRHTPTRKLLPTAEEVREACSVRLLW